MDWRDMNATMTHPRSPACCGEHWRIEWLLAWAEIGWHASVDISIGTGENHNDTYSYKNNSNNIMDTSTAARPTLGRGR
jgi:hypothetical protein